MSSRFLRVSIWACLILLAGFVAFHTRYTADLSAFLPATPSKAQQLLVDQLREGLVSRLILIDIEGSNAVDRTRASSALALHLREKAIFRSVANGETINLERDRDFIVKHRYVLSNQVTAERFSDVGLRSAIADSIDLLTSPLGQIAQEYFARDPTGEFLQAVNQLSPLNQPHLHNGVWVSRDERRALLLAETRARGSDTDAQEQAISIIRSEFAALRNDLTTDSSLVLRLSGPGVFAVQARNTIQHEAIRLSILSSSVIAIFLLVIYRSLTTLLIGFLPVASGALAGVAAVALGFGIVHGVTLGFGVTLIGEAVDYSVYLFIQSDRVEVPLRLITWKEKFWPTVRLGMLTSICGFATLIPSAFPGLAQLGVYSIAGLAAAGLTTRFVLPALMPKTLSRTIAIQFGNLFAKILPLLRTWHRVLWLIPILAGSVIYAHRHQLWNRELSALSPIPLAAQDLDASLRSDLGTPDVRTVIVLTGPSSEAILKASEKIATSLDSLMLAGAIAGYQAPSQYLPSLATQQRRRANLPAGSTLATNLQNAVVTLPIRTNQLAPFLKDLEAARTAPFIRREDLEETSMAAGLDALLIRNNRPLDRWSGILPLMATRSGPSAYSIDADRIRQAIAMPIGRVDATVLDLKQQSDELYASYLTDALRLSLLGFVAIVVLLLISLRSLKRVVRVVIPLVFAVLTVMVAIHLLGYSLTILHLIGLLLTIAIGSNYALFFDREASFHDPEKNSAFLASLLIANLTTVIGFGMLAFSTVPVLAALGMTVAPGALLALLFSAAFSKSCEQP